MNWKLSKKVVRERRHTKKKVPDFCELPGLTLTPFIFLRIHIGSSSTRKKLHSFSYSSRSSILRVMHFLWEHKTKAKQMVGGYTHTHTHASESTHWSGSRLWWWWRWWRRRLCHTSPPFMYVKEQKTSVLGISFSWARSPLRSII